MNFPQICINCIIMHIKIEIVGQQVFSTVEHRHPIVKVCDRNLKALDLFFVLNPPQKSHGK